MTAAFMRVLLHVPKNTHLTIAEEHSWGAAKLEHV